MQEALIAAAEQWAGEGVRDNPRSWLVTVASRRLVDEWRSESARRRREETVVALELPGGGRASDHDDTQDRSRWNAEFVAEGVALVTRTLGSGPVGPYQLQAAIAAVHDEAASAEQTDWPQILALSAVLERVSPGPVVTLNRAVAVAMVDGPRPGSLPARRQTHREHPGTAIPRAARAARLA